ncbi:nucleotidyltransferase domain-containing protein [Synechocystis salina LEGE 06099]|uniref:nucleotidyltransferase family protein n=1 Tax=Synechocystis salina TaxID=945780 RepID=UPI00188109DE|nr:nucleotidyltransferase domain-containing protein [Synechocystis salina]MBE9203987.1 nucleotidyltransferase domain-containing protein [Synechocystis salina LEGE 06099]
MKVITNKQRLEKRLGVSFPILDEFCQQRQITELSVFGSILREDFNFNSDIDLLVKFDTKAHISLMDIIKIENEFKILLKRNIDLVSKKAIENSKNWIRRQNILDSAEIIYAQ